MLVKSLVCNGTSSQTFGFLDNGGVFTTISATSSGPTFAFGINNLGQIVGEDCPNPGSGQCNGFLDNGGTVTTISAPGAIFTRLDGINDAGQIVGCSYPVSGCQAFLYNNGTFTTFDFPHSIPGGYSEARGINDAGEIVGVYSGILEPSTLVLLGVGLLGLYKRASRSPAL